MREEKNEGKRGGNKNKNSIQLKTKMLRLFFLLDYSLRRLNY